jgi:hypothetical protein
MINGFEFSRLLFFILCSSELLRPTPGFQSVRNNYFKRSSRLRLINLKGGSPDTAMVTETVDLIANKSSFRQTIENYASCRIRVDGREMCVWDWREMCPWAKEYSDENKQFLLEPMPNSDIHITSLHPDQPAHLDGQWKMGRTRRGSFCGVHLSHFTDVPDARQLMLIYGGPWNFDSCEVQCPRSIPCPTAASYTIIRSDCAYTAAVPITFLSIRHSSPPSS